PEPPACDLILELPMRRRDDAHIDRNRRAPADREDFPFLYDTQKLRLNARRSISDFIQKKCPPMRAREKAGLVLARIGKSAADMAKELGFYQILWDCRAVKRDK